MYKALKNFAHVGKTYFVGDVVPDDVAKTLGADFVEAPKAATPAKKTNTPINLRADEALDEGE
jgi:hypothetical protein